MGADLCARCGTWRVRLTAAYRTSTGRVVERLCEPCARQFQADAGYDKVTLYPLWYAKEPTMTDDLRSTTECECAPYENPPNPLCRVHGHEDVVSGAYAASPEVRRAVDGQLSRMNR